MPGRWEHREEAASSREFQDHCQGKHQGEPDASEARSRTCERVEVVRAAARLVCHSGPMCGCETPVVNSSQQRCCRGQNHVTELEAQICCLPARGPVPHPHAGLLGWGHQGGPVSTRSGKLR